MSSGIMANEIVFMLIESIENKSEWIGEKLERLSKEYSQDKHLLKVEIESFKITNDRLRLERQSAQTKARKMEFNLNLAKKILARIHPDKLKEYEDERENEDE